MSAREIAKNISMNVGEGMLCLSKTYIGYGEEKLYIMKRGKKA
jgi:hypothetical protein